jgi:hypothetical protein
MNKLFKIFGLTRVFAEDGASNANNSNVDGGSADKTNTGGGGGTSNTDTKTTPKDQTYEITVDGEKRQVTVDEMRNLAQKAAGAEKKFEAASKLRKEAEDGIRVKELVSRLSDSSHSPTETEIKEFAGIIGVDPSDMAEYLAKGSNEEGKENAPAIDDKVFDEAYVRRFGITPAEAKQREEYRHQQDIDRAKKEIRILSDKTVDKDEVFGKMKIGEKADDRISVIKDMVAEDVLGRIQNGEPFGAELVAASVQKIRAYLTKFGIPGKPEQYPVALGLGPSGGLPAEVNSEEPIQRVSAADPKGVDNFVARYMQRGLKKLREVNRK